MYELGNVVKVISTGEVITIDEILENGFEPLYGGYSTEFYHENELSLFSQTDIINNHINGKREKYKIIFRVVNDEKLYSVKFLKNTEVESKLESILKTHDVIFFSIYENEKALFYHTVYSGTYVYDETAKQQQVTKNNKPVMVFGYNGVRKVRSKYNVWVCNAFDFISGELDIKKILNLEGE